MSYRVLLVKLLPSAYAESFLDGNLYLNTNAYFGKIDNTDIVRFDPYDGVDGSHQLTELAILDESGKWLPLPVVGPMTTRSAYTTTLNVLCLFTITDRPGDVFDRRNLAFGDIGVVIGDLKQFIQRFEVGAAAAGKKVMRGPIEYVDRGMHDGPMGPFRKYDTHRYQNEFRFALTNGKGTACRLPIGNIRDIAYPIKATDIQRLWDHMTRSRTTS